MRDNILYDLYTEDYSADSVRSSPVTVQELISAGIDCIAAHKFVELSEKLYTSFLADTMQDSAENEQTLTVWNELLSLCGKYEIAEYDNSGRFPLHGFDIVLRHGELVLPRKLARFRLCLEQALANVNLAERKIEHEYQLIFTALNYDVDRLNAVRYNHETHQLDVVPDDELKAITTHLQMRCRKIDVQLEKKAITEQIETAQGNADKIREILENAYALIDEQTALECLEGQLKEIWGLPPVHTLTRKDLLWVVLGKDVCREDKHYLIPIRANLSFDDGTARNFNVERCAHCRQYRISFEQFESIWREYGLPKVEPVYLGADGEIGGSYWSDRSVFSDHGYTVSQEKGLTAAQRQQKLKWIIDHGIMSKNETIRFLRSRISINGMKPENWLARSKWQEDLQYIQSL